MAYNETTITDYRGYNIVHYSHPISGYYRVYLDGHASCIVLSSLKAAKNVIDTFMRNVNPDDLPDSVGGGYEKSKG